MYRFQIRMDPFNARFLARVLDDLEDAGWTEAKLYEKEEVPERMDELKSDLERMGYAPAEKETDGGRPYITFDDVHIIAQPTAKR